MRTLLLIVALFISFWASAAGGQRTPDPLPNPWNSGQKIPINPKDCTYRGIPLYGRVRITDIGATFRVRVTDIAEDLRVQIVDIAPNRCGLWQYTDIGEDFSIEFVTIGEDFSVQFVDISPGIR